MIPYCVLQALRFVLFYFGLACWTCEFEKKGDQTKKDQAFSYSYFVDVSWRQSGRRMIWVTATICDAYRRW